MKSPHVLPPLEHESGPLRGAQSPIQILEVCDPLRRWYVRRKVQCRPSLLFGISQTREAVRHGTRHPLRSHQRQDGRYVGLTHMSYESCRQGPVWVVIGIPRTCLQVSSHFGEEWLPVSDHHFGLEHSPNQVERSQFRRGDAVAFEENRLRLPV